MELIDKYFPGLTELQRQQFSALYGLYADWNAKINVVSRKDFDQLYLRHVLHSLAIAKVCTFDAGARILDESNVNTDKIQILSRVKLMNHSTNKEVEYTIVSEKEANLKAGKLSIGTPIAQALLGKKKGDKVDVQVPAGTVCFEVLDISI